MVVVPPARLLILSVLLIFGGLSFASYFSNEKRSRLCSALCWFGLGLSWLGLLRLWLTFTFPATWRYLL